MTLFSFLTFFFFFSFRLRRVIIRTQRSISRERWGYAFLCGGQHPANRVKNKNKTKCYSCFVINYISESTIQQQQQKVLLMWVSILI
jgi:hypothetical protein